MCIHTDIWDNVGVNDSREIKVCASTFPGTARQTLAPEIFLSKMHIMHLSCNNSNYFLSIL